MLEKKSRLASEKEKCRAIFLFFMHKFYRDLTNDRDLRETVVAIKGFGAFAGV